MSIVLLVSSREERMRLGVGLIPLALLLWRAAREAGNSVGGVDVHVGNNVVRRACSWDKTVVATALADEKREGEVVKRVEEPDEKERWEGANKEVEGGAVAVVVMSDEVAIKDDGACRMGS